VFYGFGIAFDVDDRLLELGAQGGVSFLQSLRNGVFDGCEIRREQALLKSWSRTDTANPIGSVILFKDRIGAVDSVGRTSAQITALIHRPVSTSRTIPSARSSRVHLGRREQLEPVRSVSVALADTVICC
jgi:hypothetical protein